MVQVGQHESLRLERLACISGSWFASYLTVAAGALSFVDVLPVVGSLAVLALLVIKLRGRLSLEYAEQLAAITTAAAPVAHRPRRSTRDPSRWFRRGEARAVALLVRGQFRNDLKFRMGVLAILPLTFVYLLMGLAGGEGAQREHRDRLPMVAAAVMAFPMMLKVGMARTDAFRASWIFFATPADRTRLVRASTHVLVALFVLPYLGFVALTLVWFTESLAYLAVYLILAGLSSYIVLLAMACIEPELPFAKPVAKDSGGLRFLGVLFGVGIFSAFLPALADLLYRSVAASVIAFLVIAALGLLLARATRRRVEGRAELMEFLG